MFITAPIKVEAGKLTVVFAAPQGSQGIYEVHVRNVGAHSCYLGPSTMKANNEGFLVESKQTPPEIIHVPAGDTLCVWSSEGTELNVLVPNALET